MPENDRDWEQNIRERAYLIWESEGRPEGREDDHWRSASNESPVASVYEMMNIWMMKKKYLRVGPTRISLHC
jgi:hypothetical protein